MKTSLVPCRWILALLIFCLVAPSSRAATYYWDGSGTTPNNIINGGTGTWNAALTNWTSSDGSANNAWVAGSDAVFSGSAGTVTLGAGQSVGNMTFSIADYLVTGNTITLSNGSIIDTASGTTTINSTLAGTTISLTKNGSGVLVVGGNNSVTGTFNITNGTVIANSAGNGKVTSATSINLGDGIGSAGSAIWQFAQNNATPFVNSTAVNIGSDGSMDLNGKSLGGNTNWSVFTLNFSGGGGVVGNGLSSTGGGAITLSSVGTGTPLLTLAGSGTYAAAGGNISITSAGSSLTGSQTGGTATLALNSGAAINTQGGNITLTSGNNGGSTVSGNTLLSSSGGGSINTGTGALIFATGTNNLGAATSSITRSGTANDSSVLNIAGNIYLGLPGGGSTQSNRQLTLGSTGIATPTADNIAISAIVSDGSGNSGNGLIKTGGFSLALTGSNTYTGTTTINQGTLFAKDGIGLPTNSNITLGGGVFESNGSFTRTLGSGSNQAVWNSGGFSARGSTLTVAIGGTASPAALTVGTSNFVTNQATFGSSLSDSRTLLVNDLNLNGVVTTFTINDNPNSSSDYTEFSGTISGSGQLLKASAGTGLLYLSNNANSSATATTRFGGGVIRSTANGASLLGGAFSFNTGASSIAVLETSGTFNRSLGTGFLGVAWSATSFGGFAAYGDDLHVQLNSGTGSLTVASTANFVQANGGLVFGSSTADHTVFFDNGLSLGVSGTTAIINVQLGVSSTASEVVLTGTVSGAANLLKLGAGRMALTGNNTYTGTTTVANGTLLVGSSNALGSATSDIQLASGTSAATDNVALLTNGAFTVSRNITVNSNNTSGTTTIGGNTDNSSTFSGNIALNKNVNLQSVTTGTSNVVTLSGTISGGAGVNKTGIGKVTLSGANLYTGATTVSAGTLIINGTTSTSGITVANGATLGGNITSTTGTTTLQNGATLAVGNSPGLGSFANLTLTGSNNTTEIQFLANASGTGGRGSQYDAINVSGATIYGGTLKLVFSGIIANNQFFDLFQLGASTSGSFDSISLYADTTAKGSLTLTSGTWSGNVDLGFGGGTQTFTFSQTTGDLGVIPEPQTWALVGIGIGFTLLRLRRKKSS